MWLRWPAAPIGATSTGGEPAAAVVGAAMAGQLPLTKIATAVRCYGAAMYAARRVRSWCGQRRHRQWPGRRQLQLTWVTTAVARLGAAMHAGSHGEPGAALGLRCQALAVAMVLHDCSWCCTVASTCARVTGGVCGHPVLHAFLTINVLCSLVSWFPFCLGFLYFSSSFLFSFPLCLIIVHVFSPFG